MKIRCNCGNEFPVEIIETFPLTDYKDGGCIRKPCPSCKRSYEMSVRLVQEKANWWEF